MKLIILSVIVGSMFMTSCEKEAPIGIQNETGSVMELRGDELDGDSSTDEGDGSGITDGGLGSDYDSSGKNKKNKNN